MTKQSRLRERLAIAAVIAVALILGWIVVQGAIQVFGTIWHVVTHVPQFSTSWDWLSDLYSSIDPADHKRHAAADKLAAIGAVFTAIFTVMLVVVTRSLGRASHRQAAGDSPLLKLELLVDPPHRNSPKIVARSESGKLYVRAASLAPGAHAPYPKALQREDERFSRRYQLPTGAAPRYVRLEVTNVQSKPFAVARDIVVTASLVSKPLLQAQARAGIDMPPYLQRRFEIEMLPPGQQKTKRVFDLAPFDEAEVSIVDVEYRDLRGRRRRKAAYGVLTVGIDKTGTIRSTDGYSEPEGWEMP